MKYFLSVIAIVAMVIVSSCTDSSSDLGLSIRPSGDLIAVGTDTFGISTSNYIVPNMVSPNDTFLLGNYYDPKYGTTKGEILAQFTCPIGFQFPAGAHPDSLSLYILFNNWFGASQSPLRISAYEMDGTPLSYNTTYYTDLNIADYCSKNILLGNRIMAAIPDTVADSATYQPHLTYKFSQAEVQKFYNAASNGAFDSQSTFTNYFKGIYLTSDYGNGAVWYVNRLYMELYFHYNAFINNKDTTLTSGLVFPASKDVRQINRITHPDISQIPAVPDSVTYICAPAGIYTQVNIPVARIVNRIKARWSGKVNSINHAELRMEVTERDTVDAYVMHIPSYLVLVPKTKINSFRVGDTTLITAAYNSTDHYYSFDLSSYLTRELRSSNPPATDQLLVIPVSITSRSAAGYIAGLAPKVNLNAVVLRTSKSVSPLRLEVVYNGF
ncbi:DUF4270 domain-containing protein [Microbacter margulisiae]|uniref:DUF4270 domain-containing protein n=1 Tax=Microbacter margulisiae TaxID=1350067 RepID=A0A7W5H2E1_9PORP|nr:DUF4270 domain-containing protein [Microbacter margulisiae]MBB3187534.1 hypothetical protein [Microbacter margulisiae]